MTPEQSGPILARVRPRLAVLHHLTVNDASRDAIVSAVRVGYPQVRPGLEMRGTEDMHTCTTKGSWGVEDLTGAGGGGEAEVGGHRQVWGR